MGQRTTEIRMEGWVFRWAGGAFMPVWKNDRAAEHMPDDMIQLPSSINRSHATYEDIQYIARQWLRDAAERIAVGNDRPCLAVTPGIVLAFETAYRAMLHEEAKPLGQRDPRPAVRVYAQAAIFSGMLRATGVPGVPEDEPGVVLSALRDLLGMRDGSPCPPTSIRFAPHTRNAAGHLHS